MVMYLTQALFWYKARNSHGQVGLVPRTFLDCVADTGESYLTSVCYSEL